MKRLQYQQILISTISLCLLAQPLAIPALSNSLTIAKEISQNQQSRGISYQRLGIGGVTLSMSESQVRRVLGKPRQQKDGYEAIAGKTKTLEYSGLTVSLLENADATEKFSVYKIETTSPKYATVDRVKVGDRLSRVIAIYGKPENTENGNLTTLSYNVNSESPAYFILTIQNGRVKTISCGDFLG